MDLTLTTSLDPFGEIVSLFDPISGTHVPVQIDDSLFCLGAALLANGNVFQAGFF